MQCSAEQDEPCIYSQSWSVFAAVCKSFDPTPQCTGFGASGEVHPGMLLRLRIFYSLNTDFKCKNTITPSSWMDPSVSVGYSCSMLESYILLGTGRLLHPLRNFYVALACQKYISIRETLTFCRAKKAKKVVLFP